MLDLADLAGVGKGADPEGAAIPAVPDGDNVRGAGGICGGETGDMGGGEEGINEGLFFGGERVQRGGSLFSCIIAPNKKCLEASPGIAIGSEKVTLLS